MAEFHAGKGDNFFGLSAAVKIPVLASGIEELTVIIRVVIKFPVSAGILLVYVRFSIVFN